MTEEWKKRSLMGKEAERLIWLSGKKKNFMEMSDENFDKMVKALETESDKPFPSPEKFLRKKLEEVYLDEMQMFVWNASTDCDRVILYLHGGAYLYQPMILHFKMVDTIAKAVNAKVYFPIYPKAPKHTYNETYALLDKLYGEILKTTPPEKITIMGDSAGGGLALGLAQWLRDFDVPQPKDIVLLSPWIDANMSNKHLHKYDKKDPLLSVWGLKRMGQLWTGKSNDLFTPMVSPIYGDMTDLGKLSIFVGTHELFYPEMTRFDKILDGLGIEHNLIIGHKLNHVFPVMPIPEARKAQKRIAEIILDEKNTHHIA